MHECGPEPWVATDGSSGPTLVAATLADSRVGLREIHRRAHALLSKKSLRHMGPMSPSVRVDRIKATREQEQEEQ